MYRPLVYRVHFKACAREGKDLGKLLKTLDRYKTVTYVVSNNCAYFDSRMNGHEIENLAYELFDKPGVDTFNDYESIYIITDGDIYVYYDRRMEEYTMNYGPPAEPSAYQIVREIIDKIKEIKQRLDS
jgi:hypothetical protein